MSKQGFSTPSSDTSYWDKNYDTLTPLENGWGRVAVNDSSSSQRWFNLFIKKGNIDLEPNTQYTFVVEIKNVSGFAGYTLSQGHASEAWSGNIHADMNVTTQQKILNQTKSDFSNLNFDLRTFLTLPANKTGTIDIRMMILKGDYTNIDINYEPYVGGIASPNPDYPQPIEVVENKQVVNVHGKNLFDKNGIFTNGFIDLTTGTQNTNANWKQSDFIKIKPNSSFIASVNASFQNSWFEYSFYDENKTWISSFQSQNATSTSNSKYLKIGYRSDMLNEYKDSIQIEESPTATTYEPYHNKDYKVDLHGKNLFNLTDETHGNNVTTSINNNEIQMTWTGAFNLYLKDVLNLDSSKTYTISFKHKGDSVNLRNKETTQSLINTGINSDYTICSATITDITNFEFNFIRSVSGTGTAYIKDIQIEEGSTPTEYEDFYNYKLCKIGDYKDEIKKSTGKNLFDIPNKTGSRGKNTFTALNQEITINSNTSGTESAFYLNDVSQVSQYLATTYENALDFNMTSVGGTYTLTLFFNYIPTNNIAIVLFTNKRLIQKSKSDWENTQCKWNITLDNDEYIKSVQFYTSQSNIFSNFKIIAQLEKNNQSTNYEPYGEQWYIKKEIGKIDLSTFAWNQAGHNVTDYKRYYTNTIPNIKYVSSNTQIGNGITEKYIISKGQGISSVTNVIAIDVSIVSVTDKNTPSGLFYYALATPTYEIITNSTLINQLEELTKLDTYNNYSAVTATGDLINPELECVLFSQPAYQK